MLLSLAVSDAHSLGNTIRRLRKKKGLTLQALARQAGLGFLTLQRLETGRQPNPRLQTLRAIARELDVPLTTLFVEEDTHAHTTQE